MIHHAIARPGQASGLRFEYDFDEQRTTISRLTVGADGTITQTAGVEVEGLLRHCAATDAAWYAAEMPKREFGLPAFVQRWDWDSLEKISEVEIPHERFGLMGMGISSDGALALVDRLFDDPEQSVSNTAAVLDLSTGQFVAHCRPFFSNLDSPCFTQGNSHVMMLHTDQGGAEARLYALDGDPPTLVAEFAEDQIQDDFSCGAIVPVPGGYAIWSATVWDFAGSFGIYEEDSFELRFPLVELPTELDDEDPDLEMQASNTDFAFEVVGDHAWVGGWGAVHRVNLLDGTFETYELNITGAVMRVVRFGDHLVALSHHGGLGVVSIG